MKTFNRILAFLFSLILLTFAGCGKQDDSGSHSGGKTEDVEIEIWISTVNQPNYFIGWFKKAFEEANEGIKLKFTPSTNLGTGLDVLLDGKGAPDMAATSGGLVVPILQKGGRIVKLEDVIGSKKDTFHEVALLNQIDNEFWCAPIFGFCSPVIFYNKTVFEANGLTVPSSYAELVSLCNSVKGIKDNGKQKYQTIVTGYTYHVLQAMSGKTMSKDQLDAIIQPKTASATNPFDNDAMLNTYKWVEQMRKDGIFAQNLTGYTSESAANNFATQKALMVMCPGLDLLDYSKSCNFEVGAFTLPDAPDAFATEGAQGGISGIYNDCLVVNSKSQHVEECKKVIEFMYSDAAQRALFNSFLYPVVKNTSYENVDASKKALFDAAFKPIYDEARDNGMSIFWMNYFYKSGLDSACESSFNAVINNSETVEQAWARLKNAW